MHHVCPDPIPLLQWLNTALDVPIADAQVPVFALHASMQQRARLKARSLVHPFCLCSSPFDWL